MSHITGSYLDEETCYGILSKLFCHSMENPKLASINLLAAFAIIVATAGNLCASGQKELAKDITTSPSFYSLCDSIPTNPDYGILPLMRLLDEFRGELCNCGPPENESEYTLKGICDNLNAAPCRPFSVIVLTALSMPHIHNKDGTLEFATDCYCFSKKDTHPQGIVLLKRENVLVWGSAGTFYYVGVEVERHSDIYFFLTILGKSVFGIRDSQQV
jgi:hypothetical protein